MSTERIGSRFVCRTLAANLMRWCRGEQPLWTVNSASIRCSRPSLCAVPGTAKANDSYTSSLNLSNA
jgi:hypothetical protein